MEPGDLIDDWLPGEDFRLELDVATLPHITPSQIERLALQENRTRLRIEIDPPNMRATEYSSRAVGELLLLTQNVYDNIGLALHDDNPPQSGRIPFNVAEQTASNLVGASAASFVLELASSTYDDLFGEALFTRSTKSLMDLLDAELDRSQLSEKLAALRPRAAKSFRRFVTGLANTNGGATVAAAGAHMSYFSRELSPERLRTLVSILTNLVPDDDVREIRGRMTLYLGDTQRRIFGLRDEGTGDTYEGKVDDRAFSAVHSATLDDPYDVVLFEVSVLDEVVGETTVTYSLVQLSSVDPD
ncbi:hypothetical protein [Amycolatopsis sp. NPDC001319]|uniref:hypothetical protein n=1 Tax=unclassified Amycolatopsis TaxID=2618356 RepID=UPI0036AFDDFC